MNQLNVFTEEEIVAPAKLSRDILEEMFCETIFNLSAEELVAQIYTPYEAVIHFAQLCRGDKTGQKISMLFNPHRFDIPAGKSLSIVAALKDKRFLSGLARATAWKEGLSNELLHFVLQLGVNGVQYVNEFPPYTARDIYCEFGGKRILDPCAGWGGRMIGAASVGAYYHGFEPSTRTHAGLLKLGAWLKRFDTGFDFKIENLPFEDGKISDDYDVALTSPPYYDTEKYAPDESTQSAVRFESFDSWADGFYKPLVQRATTACKNGLVLNIGNRRYPLKDKLFETEGINVRDIRQFSMALGGRGIGKNPEDGEKFWHVTRKS